MRKKLYEIVEPAAEGNLLSHIYDVFMMLAIVASIIPLGFKESTPVLVWMDRVAVAVFILDYVLRLSLADLKLRKSVSSFVLYPLTPMAVVDLVSILPSMTVLNGSFRLLKVFRLLRAIKVLRLLKFLRYSKTFGVVANVLRKQKKVLSAVATLAIGYIVISALLIYNIEPESFDTFFDALYWATISLTTVGYGDIYPVSDVGRVVTMVSSVFGIAVVALPAGVITAGYMAELTEFDNED